MEENERDKELEKKAMKIFEEWPRTEIVFGKGTLKQTGQYAKEFGNSALIVIGQGSVKKYGYLDTLLSSLDAEDISCKIYEGVEPNPSKGTIEDIAKVYQDGNFDMCIALGGGSAMDAAKAALILAKLGEDN